jgi:glucose-6-phosphate isomerase
MSFQEFIAMMEDYPQTDATLTNTSLDEDASIIYGTYEIYNKECGAFKP